MPDEVVIDLAGLDIGDSIHISAVSLPKGTKSVIEDRDFTIATVVAPSGVKAEAAEAAAAAAAAEGIEAVEPGQVPPGGEEEAAHEAQRKPNSHTPLFHSAVPGRQIQT